MAWRPAMHEWMTLAEAAIAAGKGAPTQGALVSLGREIADWNRTAAPHERVAVTRRGRDGQGSILRVEGRSLARMLTLKSARQEAARQAVEGVNCPGIPESSDHLRGATKMVGGRGQVFDAGAGGRMAARRRAARPRPAVLRTFPEGESPFERSR